MKTTILKNEDFFEEHFFANFLQAAGVCYFLGDFSAQNFQKWNLPSKIKETFRIMLTINDEALNGMSVCRTVKVEDIPQLTEIFIISPSPEICFFGIKNGLVIQLESGISKKIPAIHEKLEILSEAVFAGDELAFRKAENVLRLIDDLISDNDTESLQMIAKQLENKSLKLRFSTFTEQLAVKISQRKYKTCQSMIKDFLNGSKQLVLAIDQNDFVISLFTTILREQLLYLQHIIIESEKTLNNFNAAYNTLIKGHIMELYRMKIAILESKLKNEPENAELLAELNEVKAEYEQHLMEKPQNIVYLISEKQKVDMKKMFKHSVKMCYPDLVEERFRKNAEQVFIELKKAYDRNDIEAVSEIHETLKSGIFKMEKNSNEIGRFTSLFIEYKVKQTEYLKLFSNPKFLAIKDNQDFDVMFKDQLVQVMHQLENYKLEFESFRNN
jgi:hypothetical protein